MIRSLIISLLLTCALLGADRYVSTTGTDAGSGAIGAPWQTISYGVRNMDGGDTLWLRGGTHTSPGPGFDPLIKSGPSSTSFTSIRGYPGEFVRWKPTSTGYLLSVGLGTSIRSNIWIGDFTIDGGSRSASGNPFIGVMAGWNVVITNMVLTNSSGIACVLVRPNDQHWGARGLVIVSNIFDRWGTGSGTAPPHALYVKAESGLVVRGNRLNNNYVTARADSYAIHLYDGTGYRSTNAIIEGNLVTVRDGAAVIGYQTDSIVRNNLFVSLGSPPMRSCVLDGYTSLRNRYFGNTIWGGSYGVQVRSDAENSVFANNIFWGASSRPIEIASYSPSYWTNNIAVQVPGGAAASAAVLQGNMFGSAYNPQFLDAPTDLKWSENSPARNTGVDLSGMVSVDYYGTARPQESFFDVGAYEWPASGQLPTVRVEAGGSAFELGLISATFTFTRTENNAGNLTVNYTIAGTATSGVHYTAFSDSVVISDGQWTATATVTPLAVDGYEGNKTVIVTLDADAAYTVSSPSVATIEIVEGDPPATNLRMKPPEPGKSFLGGRRR